MRTIQWYDVMWSKDKLNVNDEVVITGKFHVAEDWPRGVPKPDATYLNVSSPGPVFVRTERYLNGQASVSSAALKLGGDYDFKIVLKARLPGRYHLHPFFNLHDAGAVMGPGHWFEVAGDAGSFHQSGENARRQCDRHGNLWPCQRHRLARVLVRARLGLAALVGPAATVHSALQDAPVRPREVVDHVARQENRHGHPVRRAAVRSWRQRDDGSSIPQRHPAPSRDGSNRAAAARSQRRHGKGQSSADGIPRARSLDDHHRANSEYVGPIDQDWRVCNRQCAFSQSWR